MDKLTATLIFMFIIPAHSESEIPCDSHSPPQIPLVPALEYEFHRCNQPHLGILCIQRKRQCHISGHNYFNI